MGFHLKTIYRFKKNADVRKISEFSVSHVIANVCCLNDFYEGFKLVTEVRTIGCPTILRKNNTSLEEVFVSVLIVYACTW